MNSSNDTTGPGSTDSSAIDTQVTVTSLPEVESTHTTHDFFMIEMKLIEGEVVTTRTSNVTGSFGADAVMGSLTTTDINGEIHTAFGVGSSGGMTTNGEGANDLSFHD